MKKRLVICVNHFLPSVGGCEFVTKTIAEYLSTDFEVFVLTRRVKHRSDKDFKGYSVIEYIYGDVNSFLDKISKLSPDIVFIYSDMFDFFRHICFKVNRFKLIVALCGANWIHTNRQYANLFYRNIRNIEKIILHSTHERDYKFCSSGELLDKTIIIPNGVHIHEFDNIQLSRKDLFEEIYDRYWVLNVSNFFPGKGQEHLINILLNLPNPQKYAYIQISNDIEFTIGKEMEDRWRLKAKKLESQGVFVCLKKNLPRQQVVAFFKNSNIFVTTSEKEVAPLCILEAMCANIPWVSMDIGNAIELQGGKCIKAAKNQNYHSIFDARVHSLFVNAIHECLKRPVIAESGRIQIEQKFNWDLILPKYSEVFAACG